MTFPRISVSLLLLLPGTASAQTGAAPDAYTTAEDTLPTRNAAQRVMANDPGGPTTVAAAGMVGAPLNGTVTLAPDGSFTWSPAAN
jgi:Bacterial cadherin-like domain